MHTTPPFDVAILTVPRATDYLAQTLASLFASGRDVWTITPIHLVAGSTTCPHLEGMAHHRALRVHAMDEPQWQLIRDWHVHRRLAYNLWRAASLPCETLYGRCICEDDIVFADGFIEKLVNTIREIRAAENDKFVLAAYSPYDFANEAERRRGRWYCSYNASAHYGNCCLFVSKPLLSDLAQTLWLRTVEHTQAPADIAIGEFMEELWKRREGGMYQTVSSLAQHMGFVSGGTSERYFSSPTFGQAWPE